MKFSFIAIVVMVLIVIQKLIIYLLLFRFLFLFLLTVDDEHGLTVLVGFDQDLVAWLHLAGNHHL